MRSFFIIQACAWLSLALADYTLHRWAMKLFFVYMLASRRHGALYIGVTNDLSRRVSEHRSKVIPGFTAKYDVTRLVWYESYERIDDAIAREKALKKWRRDWKIRLIEEMNPEWEDLYLVLNQ